MSDRSNITVKLGLEARSHIASAKLRCFCIALFGAQISTGLNAQSLTQAEEVALVQRTLQAEFLLRTPSSVQVDLCIDQAINGVWLLGDGTRSPPSHLVDRLRRASELCNDQERTDKERLATQLSRTIQRQAENASRIADAKASARRCIDRSRDESEYRACITESLGENAVQTGWPRWNALYRSRSN